MVSEHGDETLATIEENPIGESQTNNPDITTVIQKAIDRYFQTLLPHFREDEPPPPYPPPAVSVEPAASFEDPTTRCNHQSRADEGILPVQTHAEEVDQRPAVRNQSDRSQTLPTEAVEHRSVTPRADWTRSAMPELQSAIPDTDWSRSVMSDADQSSFRPSGVPPAFSSQIGASSQSLPHQRTDGRGMGIFQPGMSNQMEQFSPITDEFGGGKSSSYHQD
ncbi:uncharacterized protein LOC120072971 [Benincasa hispida]|uniref:uncharacterized protein LOC120072971 n=1 Tax=Benincasa hispida TaxID=102211 RepID=UPI00190130F6|nr:uncharacterized protein LOC120072971 [Benincasa hispida]